MNALQSIQSLGAVLTLADNGKLKVGGLDRLDRDTAAYILDTARTYKAEIMAELRTGASALPSLTMANACIYCDRWRDRPGFPWWSGTCAATGEKKGRRSVCTVPGVGVLQ